MNSHTVAIAIAIAICHLVGWVVRCSNRALTQDLLAHMVDMRSQRSSDHSNGFPIQTGFRVPTAWYRLPGTD